MMTTLTPDAEIPTQTRPVHRVLINAPWSDRLANYEKETGFARHLFIAADGRVVGTMVLGNDYRVKSQYYGGYPAGYLKRMRALFFDKKSVLHLCSGKVDLTILPGETVDINPELKPDYVDDAQTLTKVPLEKYDLVLTDTPYSAEDCEHYGTPMLNRNKVMQALATRMTPGAHVAFLDQVLPMYRKDQWRSEGYVGVVKSTNHRFRVVTIFRKL